MKSLVKETKERVIIENIPSLILGESMVNTFVRSAQLALNALGENWTYEYLMGISGAAFRLHFKPDWCTSSIDATVGYDVSKIVFKSLGYKCELVQINTNDLKQIMELYQRIKVQINLGFPIVAINLKSHMDWGIITGYQKTKPGIICRTIYDKGADYELAERAPMLSFFIKAKEKPMGKDEVFRNSLKIAVELAKKEEYEEYKNGFSAYEKWIDELKRLKEREKDKKYREITDTNLVLLAHLIDSRRAAVAYLISKIGRMKKGDAIIHNYVSIVYLLEKTEKNILPSHDSGMSKWTNEALDKQIDILTKVLALEKETIGLIEQELE